MLSDPRKRLDVTLSQGDFAFVKYRDTASHRLRRSSPAPATIRQCVAVSRTSTGLPDAPHRDGNTAPPRSPRAHPRHDSSSGGSGVIRRLAAEGVR
jgi:hypothetical protein